MTAAILIKNETALGAAIATRNTPALSTLTHPSFTYWGIHPAGRSFWTRAEWVKAVFETETTTFVHSTTDVLIVGQPRSSVWTRPGWAAALALPANSVS